MKEVVNLIFYVGFLFFGGGFIIALSQFVLYNGVGDFFEYLPSDKFVIEKKEDRMPNQFVYKYFIEDVEYISYQNVSSSMISKIDLDTLIVLYNKNFKNFSVIQGVVGKNSKSWDQMVGMLVMGIPFIFIFLIYKFADMNKWIGVYAKGVYRSTKENRLE